jgi:arsenate reductase
MKKILFVCVHNSGRSQMAEAFFNNYANGKAQAFSAGTQPASHTDRNVLQAMREIGIDISAQRPKMLTLKMMEDADRVITMGCGVEGVCPATLVPTEDWQLEDPEGKPIERVRAIRDEVETKVKRLIEELQDILPGSST